MEGTTLPSWAAGFGAEISGAFDAVMAEIGPVAITVIVGFAILKLIKRGGNKAV